MEDYKKVNRQSWNERTKHHITSDFYDVKGFLEGRNSLNSVEIDLMGNLKGKSVLHLQCHFGQDSISMARMGAQVTGADISDEAITQANRLAKQAGVNVDFICCDIYDLPEHLNKSFDIVFTSYGVIGWLPDLEQWAKVINHFLKPGGKLIMVEFHPVVWMFDNDFEEIKYSYFKDEAIIETETGTYTNPEAPVELTTITWNHSLSEVLGALLSQRLNITAFEEYDYSPYNCFKHTMEKEKGRYVIKHLGGKLPIVYALAAEKP